MTKPRDSGHYNAKTFRTRLTDLVDAKTNFIVAHEAETAMVLITVPMTDKQFHKASEGFVEVGTPETLASVLAELSVRARPDDAPFAFAVDPSLDEHHDDPLLPGADTVSDGEFHDAEELPPGTAERMDQEFEDPGFTDPEDPRDDDDPDAPRTIAIDDEVYMLTDRRIRYKVVAIGRHVATLSYIDQSGDHKYITVPFGTFAWIEE